MEGRLAGGVRCGGKPYTGGQCIVGSACSPCHPPSQLQAIVSIAACMPGTRARCVEVVHAETWGISGSRGKSLGLGALLQLPRLPREVSLCHHRLAEQKGSVPAAPVHGAGEAPHVTGQTSAPQEPQQVSCGRAALFPGASASRQCPLLWDRREGSSSTWWTRVLRGRGSCRVCLWRSCLWWFLGAPTPDMDTDSGPILPLWARASSPLSAVGPAVS